MLSESVDSIQNLTVTVADPVFPYHEPRPPSNLIGKVQIPVPVPVQEQSGWLMSLLHGGVNHSIYGNGGPECMAYVSQTQRWTETFVLVPLFCMLASWAYKHIKYPAFVERTPLNNNLRRAILAVYCITFGVEIGYKLTSRTAIYLLNPCHLLTAFHIYALLFDASDHWMWSLTFRLHVHSIAGGTLAMAFPVLNTRLVPWQRIVYWTQHWLIVLTPFYLYTFGGSFQFDPLGYGGTEGYMTVFALALLLLYHFVPLQFFGMWSHVNLNNMMCPAVSDPFKCKYWRIVASVHQSAWVPLHSYLYIGLLNRVRPFLLTLVISTGSSSETGKHQLQRKGSLSENGTVHKQRHANHFAEQNGFTPSDAIGIAPLRERKLTGTSSVTGERNREQRED